MTTTAQPEKKTVSVPAQLIALGLFAEGFNRSHLSRCLTRALQRADTMIRRASEDEFDSKASALCLVTEALKKDARHRTLFVGGEDDAVMALAVDAVTDGMCLGFALAYRMNGGA